MFWFKTKKGIAKDIRRKLVELIKEIGRENDILRVSAKVIKFVNKYDRIIKKLNNDKCKEGLLAADRYASLGISQPSKHKSLISDIGGSLNRILEGLDELMK